MYDERLAPGYGLAGAQALQTQLFSDRFSEENVLPRHHTAAATPERDRMPEIHYFAPTVEPVFGQLAGVVWSVQQWFTDGWLRWDFVPEAPDRMSILLQVDDGRTLHMMVEGPDVAVPEVLAQAAYDLWMEGR